MRVDGHLLVKVRSTCLMKQLMTKIWMKTRKFRTCPWFRKTQYCTQSQTTMKNLFHSLKDLI
ncbi:hypothetical protein DPMN_038193 [Dreissena polymorpha]|uniref:Uncharacterized protein n=1 Tax=Dreissena polymorpha TaxID=45954 RepID=A0A9D4RMZ2_DREPO|nr:hypothetical protein DPMN_038193 [Dreissena polymorpha]